MPSQRRPKSLIFQRYTLEAPVVIYIDKLRPVLENQPWSATRQVSPFGSRKQNSATYEQAVADSDEWYPYRGREYTRATVHCAPGRGDFN